jgi:hypothetical protein
MPSNRFRTTIKAYGFVTHEEEMKLQDHVDMWIKRAFRTDPIDPAEAVASIQALYAAAKLKFTPRVVIAPSPLAGAFIYGAAAAAWHRLEYPGGSDSIGTYNTRKAAEETDKRLKDSLLDTATRATQNATGTLEFNPWNPDEPKPTRSRRHESVSEKMRNHAQRVIQRGLGEVIAQGLLATISTAPPKKRRLKKPNNEAVRAAERQLITALQDAIRASAFATDEQLQRGVPMMAGEQPQAHNTAKAMISAAVQIGSTGFYDTLESAYANACFEIAGTLGIECARQWSYACQGGNTWAAFECFVSGMRDVIGLRLPEYEAFAAWERAALAGHIRFCHENFCVVSDFPEFIKTDEQGRAHCDNGPSHRYRDGWALYNWHGTPVPEQWIDEKHLLTAGEALTWPNVEQRRAACEILGWANILQQLDAKVIDDDRDPEIGQLLAVNLPGVPGFANTIPARFLRVRCGTGRDFCICVPTNMQTAIQAQAWMIGLDPEQFKRPEVRA